MRTGHRGHRAWVRVLGVVVGLAAGAAGAGASPPPNVKVTITPSPGAGAVPRAPIAQAPQAPGSPAIATADATPLHGLEGVPRPEQERILAELIAGTPDTEAEEKADYLFRLAELYAKLHRTWKLKSAELALRAETSRAPQAKAEATAAAEQVKLFDTKANQAFQTLVNNERFHKYPKLDQALFYYGATLQSAGHLVEARAIYHRLLKQHPRSKYVPDAYLTFAELFFEQGQLPEAERLYKQVLKYPKASVYWFALYKSGWIQLNLQRFQEALETFSQVVQGTKQDPGQQRLHLAAALDFVRAYAEIGTVEKAFVAFQRVDAAQAFAMLERLADLYLELGKTDAITAYRYLINGKSNHPSICQWRFNLACATAYGAGAAQTVEICPQDLGRFKEWARVGGVPISCAVCRPAATP